MAHLHKKMKKGRPYYYVRETARVGGRSKVVNQVYLGSADRIMEMALSQEKLDISKLQIKEFRSLFLANLMENYIGISNIIDSVAIDSEKSKSPNVGEYFLFSVINRMTEPRSKEALSKWYKDLAVHQIRPVDIDALNSKMYWKKWSQLSTQQIQEIAHSFFAKVNPLEPLRSDCLMFDTTNYFTYMDSKTASPTSRSWQKQRRQGLAAPNRTGSTSG